MNDRIKYPRRRGVHTPPEVRFWRHVRFASSGCWEWTASTNEHGYGQLNVNGRMRKVPRWVYERTFRELPSPAVVVRHTCDNPLCVRAAHLVEGTMRDNTRDMIDRGRCRGGLHNKMKTHCIRGHEYTSENTVHEEKGRACRACKVARGRAAAKALRTRTGLSQRKYYEMKKLNNDPPRVA